MKEKSKQVTAPAVGKSNIPAGVRSVDDLVSLLKEADERERLKLRKALPFYGIAAIIFGIAFVAVVVPGSALLNPSTLLLRGLLMILYIFIAASVWLKVKGLAKIDYAEPVRTFLAKAEKRYAFGKTQIYVLAFGITLFLGYAAFLYIRDVLRRYLEVTASWPGLVVTLLFFVFVYAFGLWATRKNWIKGKQDIWLQIRKMREELEREEGNGKS